MGEQLLADTEHFRAVDVRSAPGDGAPLPRVHAHHASAFFVLEGELTLRLEGDAHRIGEETWVFVPPGVAHSLAMSGDVPARHLEIQVPSSELIREIIVRRTGGSEGEKITDRPGRRATVLVDTAELTVSEFAYGPGERGAKPHVHHHHADGFLVVEGEFMFALRAAPLAIRAGTLLLFPPDVVHGFDNDSTAAARCFNFHMPSFGFADYLRGRNPGFDQHDPPEDGVDPAAVVVAHLPE
jgi:quercetin dioxygenase-like cupin family protein